MVTQLPRATTAALARGLPGIGSALDLLRDPYGWWPRQYAEHGPVFRLTLPIEGRTWIAIAGRDANALLAREGHRLFSQKMTYPSAPKVLGTDLHPSITEGALQRHLRRQVAPGFSRQAVEPHLPAMTTRAREHVDRWRPGQRLDVTAETSRMGLDCVSIFAKGSPLSLESDAVRRYATVFTGVIAMSWPMALMRWPGVRDAREGLDRMIERGLEEHRRVPPGDARAADYFDFLLAGTMPDGSPLPERVRVVFGQIPFKNMGVYAGRVINHVLYQLVTRPEVLARVQPEIDRVLADDEITLDEIASMPITRAAILETLRMLPIAVALQRTVCEPFDFAGYRFEVGDRLFTPISVTHFLPEHFPEPERFDLDRFLPERSEDQQRDAYNPFGLGHHACVARGVFEAITIVVVGTILHRWKLDAPYRLRTIVDALPGPWPWHAMRVVERREVAPPVGARRRSPTRKLALSAPLLDAIDRSPTITLDAGEVLFREGEVPDRIFFVLEGSLAVTKQDGAIAVGSAGAGDVVGEIGILHGVPRTATVTATSRSRLIAIDGALFLRAVVDEDVSARELGDLARRRHAGALLASILSSSRAPELLGRGTTATLHARPGELLIREGEDANLFYLLVAGSVDVAIERHTGGPLLLGRLRAPDCFGEIGLLENRPRTASVRVSSDEGARLITLDRVAFDALTRDAHIRSALGMIATERAADTDGAPDASLG